MYGSNPLYPHDSSKLVSSNLFRIWIQKTNLIPKLSLDFHPYLRPRPMKPPISKKIAKNHKQPILSVRSSLKRLAEPRSKRLIRMLKNELTKRKANF